MNGGACEDADDGVAHLGFLVFSGGRGSMKCGEITSWKPTVRSLLRCRLVGRTREGENKGVLA
jgi:hypothetical protein